jgi:subtilase family protein
MVRRVTAILLAFIPAAAYPLPAQAAPDTSAAEVILEVKFDEELVVRGAGAGLHSQRGHSLARVEAVLERYGVTTLRPFVPGQAADRLAGIAARWEARTGEPVPDLASWYTVILPAGTGTDQVLADLRALSEIDYAEPAPVTAPPPPQQTDTPDFTGMQRHFGPAAQNGIDADFTRQDPRLRGGGIKIVDLEYNWNPFHEDLQLDWSTDLGGTRFPREDAFGDDHGTAVFGELVAVENEYGVSGGVPDAEVFGISPVEQLPSGTAWRPGPALAFLAALDDAQGGSFLRPGDVVLLEQQAGQQIPDSDCPVEPGSCFSPLEWLVPVHEAIRVLTSMGVNVVATGGNGHNSTAHPAYTRNGQPWFRPDNHSGSILVGAGDSNTRERLGFSNHGPRFDLQGWGHQIITTGYCTLYCVQTDHDIRYSRTFGGTSGAGPIVTVAVAVIQSYLRATGQEPWTAREVADLLDNTGQPQGSDPAGEHIGPLPNLRAALAAIGWTQP